MKWIDGTDLKQWAERRDSQDMMPELLRRLVHASLREAGPVSFPAGDAVQLGGWDGTVECAESHAWVPQGHSGWEIGVNDKVKAKADKDYTKRTDDPEGLDPSKTTFVFVTPRRWGGKSKWVNLRRKEAVWANVLAYDADDLEQWLEQTPAVAVWLATSIGKFAATVQSLSDYWNEFSAATRPPLTSEVLVADRDPDVSRLRNFITNSPASLVLEADTRREAVAFVAAALRSFPEPLRTRVESRVVVSADIGTLRHLSTTSKPLALIWQAEDTTGVGRAVASGHHVIVPYGSGQSPPTGLGMRLGRPRRERLVQALVKAGLPDSDAGQVARESGHSIAVLQRMLAVPGSSALPVWASAERAGDLIPVLLAGAWVQGRSADESALAQIAGKAFSDVERSIVRSVNEPDAPLHLLAGVWSLISPADALVALGRHITGSDLDRFAQTTVSVLSLNDPALELAPGDRWMRSVYEKEFPHSGRLRQGLAKTLLLLGVLGESVGLLGSVKPQDYVNEIVRRLLGGKPGGERWYSIAHLLPTLAEAAPDVFLGALEEDLASPSPQVLALFEEEGPFASGAYPHLLWALETLGWEPRYLQRVTLALERLAALDPGGRLANRPRASLRNLFLTWRPQTSASLLDRNAAIDLLLAKLPEIGWQLLEDLLPKGHDVASPSHSPARRWRPAVQLTLPERIQAMYGVVDRALENSDAVPTRLSILMEHASWMAPHHRSELWKRLTTAGKVLTSEVDRSALWTKARDTFAKHSRFRLANWALPDDDLNALQKIIDELAPTDPTQRYGWLFNAWWPDLPVSDEKLNEYEARINSERAQAIRTIFDQAGRSAVLVLASNVELPQFVGSGVASALDDQNVRSIAVEALKRSDRHSLMFGLGIAQKCASEYGADWVDGIVPDLVGFPDGTASLLLALPVNRLTWNKAEALGTEVIGRYWASVHPVLDTETPREDVKYALEQLGKVNRRSEALFVTYHHLHALTADDLCQVLESYVTSLSQAGDPPNGGVGQLDIYQLQEVINAMAEKGADKGTLLRFEWTFLPLLQGPGRVGTPRLHQAMADDPTWFVDIVRLLYKPALNDNSEDEVDDQEDANEDENDLNLKSKARVAWHLLSEWRLLPGTSADGALDASRLVEWVRTARELCDQTGHLNVADARIGQLLAESPLDEDGLFPHRAVREVLEKTSSDAMLRGFRTGVYNKRGFHTRALGEGGLQERQVAETVGTTASRIAAESPLTSSVLSQLAKMYTREAEKEDEEAARLDLDT